jgi:hypothetical protein
MCKQHFLATFNINIFKYVQFKHSTWVSHWCFLPQAGCIRTMQQFIGIHYTYIYKKVSVLKHDLVLVISYTDCHDAHHFHNHTNRRHVLTLSCEIRNTQQVNSTKELYIIQTLPETMCLLAHGNLKWRGEEIGT